MSRRLTSVSVRTAHYEYVERISDSGSAPPLAPDTDANAVLFEMFASKNKSAIDRREAPSFASPTTTPNGYSLIPERSPLVGTPDCRFRVLGPDGTQRSIAVCFDGSLVTRIDRKRSKRRTHLWIASRFWVLCAERHLALYLSEVGGCPPNGQLMIDGLDDDEMLLATYWKD
jgi:hypothetical protein